jgi:Capsule polysaccharide biosynthesis protein
MKYLFTTLQFIESDFYGRVTDELRRLGDEAEHVVWSRRSAGDLRAKGYKVSLMPDAMRALPPFDVEAEQTRILDTYETPTIRDIYKTDWPCAGRSEAECVERTVRHFLALERIIDEAQPDVIVPEVGSESMRTVTHLVGLQRGIPVFFLFYTIFDDPLRLYANTMHAPIVPQEEVRPLTPAEREEVEDFISRFKARAAPIRKHRKSRVTRETLRQFVRHVFTRVALERDNDYLTPTHYVRNWARENLHAAALSSLYTSVPTDRRFVYFPLHVTDDYKIKRVIPHCVDQAMLIRQVADSLPHGYDVVLKEHPLSIGRNPYGMLRRLTKLPNVRLVNPYESSHLLIQRAEAVIVISSTVGLEALMYDKPVLTMGEPFYAGYGVTLDLSNFKHIRERVPQVLEFRPDHDRILEFLHAAKRACYPGRPVLVNQSDKNARELAESLHRAAREGVTARPEQAVLT